MKLSKKSDELWTQVNPAGDKFMNNVFKGIEKNDMEAMRRALSQILINLEKMDE